MGFIARNLLAAEEWIQDSLQPQLIPQSYQPWTWSSSGIFERWRKPSISGGQRHYWVFPNRL
jgi:hypothetical protein